MPFVIQDPSCEQSMYLHESLLTACKDSSFGVGVYAFATKDGIDLILDDPIFKEFIKDGSYILIVGLDDITNLVAINALKHYVELYNGHLTVWGYVHDSRKSVFHPKFCFFKKQSGGVLIVGSGNLTQRGLRQNREAYSFQELNETALREVENTWNSWYLHSSSFLFDINNLSVAELAERNQIAIRAIAEAKRAINKQSRTELLDEIIPSQPKDCFMKGNKEFDSIDQIESSYWEVNKEDNLLVAEIPKSGDRWKQANFDKTTFETYFGATCGENGQYRILLKSVSHEGVLGQTEPRPSVSVASQNYRFELDAATGLDYPADGNRPIAVFAKVSVRNFLYELFMPGDELYDALNTIIDEKQPKSTKMRRLQFCFDEIKSKIPSMALLKYAEDEEYDLF